MKKLIFSLSALAALFLAGSCQRENLEPVEQGGTVTYTVQVPEAIATKAIGDQITAVDKVYYEVYRAAEVEDLSKTPVYQGSETVNSNGQASFSLEFVKGQEFVVLFWAQKSALVNTDVTSDAGMYNIDDLRAVKLVNPGASNNEEAQVFAGSDTVTDCESAANGNVTLTRPVSQINVYTTTESLSFGDVTIGLNTSDMTVAGLYNTYNVATGDAVEIDENESTFVYAEAAVPTATADNDALKYVAMNYVGFAPKNGTTVKVDFNIQTTEAVKIKHSVSNVPVKPNYRTNIVGNLISATTDYNVTLNNNWWTPDTNVEVVAVSTAQDLQEAINNVQTGTEGNIKLEGNIDLSALFGASTLSVTKAGNAVLPFIIEEGEILTLDLNGFTISTPWEDESAGKHYYAFENHGTLTILDSKGTGKIVARGNFNYGKMTLESGAINACDGNGGYGVRNYEGAEFVMNGGTIATIYEDGDEPKSGNYDACPIRVDEGAKAVINGGIINNVSNFTVAIDNYGETIVNDGTFTSVHTTLANSASMTINGGSFTCNGLEGITAHALWAAAGKTTINGGTFDGKDNYNGFNVDASAGAVVDIIGGKFRPVHSGSLYGEGTIMVTGGEFFDDPSARVADDYVAVKDETANVYNVVEAYAKVGEVKYTSLNDAFASVPENGEATIVVLRDAEMDAVTVASGKTITLDLNGKTITGVDTATGSYGLITNKANLTVKGPGAIKLSATNDRDWNAYSSVISNTVGGNLTVEGGAVLNHLGGTDMAYGIDNLTNGKGTSAVTTIKDATVISTYRAVRQFLNGIEATNELYVEEGAVITGANKSIWMQDPSANLNTGKLVVEEGAVLNGDVYLFVTAGSEAWPVEVSIADSALAGESTVMTGNVPAGYTVENVDGIWMVIAWENIDNTADLQKALAAGKNVVLANDLTITPEEMTTAPYGNKMALEHNGGVFNGNGKNISVTANGDNYVVMTNGGTIKNLDIDRGFRGIVLMYPNQDIYVDNVNIGVDDEVCYTINTAEGDGTHSLYVSNSVLNGWCSIGTAVKDVTFTNCTFGQGTYYTNVYGRLVKPYVDAIFDGCDFCSMSYLDLSAFVGTKVTLKNCTVNGVKLTAQNWTSLVVPESTCGEGQISIELKNGTYMTADNVADYIVIE